MKQAAVLFAFAWALAFFLGGVLDYPAMDAMSLTRWLTSSPAALAAVAAVLGSVRFLLVGAFFRWLRGEEGDWRRDALIAWGGTLAVDVVLVAFQTRFSALGLAVLVTPWQALNLAACFLGAWLAEDNAWRPALREARQWLLSFDWAR